MNNKKIKTALVAAMLTSTMAYNIPAINATTLTQKSVDNPVLVPTPKKVTYEENIYLCTCMCPDGYFLPGQRMGDR